jgi:hypothetical protein
MTTVAECLKTMPSIEEVRFVTFGERATQVAEATLAALRGAHQG